MPSLQLSAETHTESLEGTSEEKPLRRQRKSAGVTGPAWSLKHSGKKNSEKVTGERTAEPQHKGREHSEWKHATIDLPPLLAWKSSHLHVNLTVSHSPWKERWCIFSDSSENFERPCHLQRFPEIGWRYWTCKTAWLPPLPDPFALPSLPQVLSQGHSLRNDLNANLQVRVCIPGNPTWTTANLFGYSSMICLLFVCVWV